MTSMLQETRQAANQSKAHDNLRAQR